jgi:uncharacterized protein (TIGR03000 family)
VHGFRLTALSDIFGQEKRSKIMVRKHASAALAALVVVFAAVPCALGQGLQNQQGWPLQGGGGGGGGYGSYPSYSYSQPTYSPPTYAVSPAANANVPQTTAQAPQKAADVGFVSFEVPHDNTCLLNLNVPADAQIFFGKTPAEGQTGSRRQFRSPQLEPGETYQYQLRARWMQNGQWVEKTRAVEVHANDVVNVDFNKPG